jgi:hypothetical protein
MPLYKKFILTVSGYHDGKMVSSEREKEGRPRIRGSDEG